MTYVIWTTADATLDPDRLCRDVVNNAATLWAQARALSPNQGLNYLFWGLAVELYRKNYYQGEVPSGEPWFAGAHSEPGNYLFRQRLAFAHWPSALHELIGGYLDDIGTIFGTAPGTAVLFSYDLLNEPDYNSAIFQGARDIMMDLVGFTQQRLMRRAPTARFTIGFAGLGPEAVRFMSDLYLRGVKLQYVSSHAYRTTLDISDFARTVLDGKRIAAQQGLDYVCSEFWARWLAFPPPAPVAPYLRVLRGLGVGGQIWSFLEMNIFYRDAWEFWRHDPTVLPIAPRSGVGLQPILTRLPQPEAIDGIRRPRRGIWRFDSPWVQVVPFDPSGPGSQQDLNEILIWARS